jgi:hypothetical protein
MNIKVTHTAFPAPPNLRESIAMALNETANEAREEGIKVITDKYNTTPMAIRKVVNIEYAKPDQKDMKAVLKFGGRKMGLIDFKPMKTPTGMIVEIERGKPKRYTHAFIPTDKGGAHKINRVVIRIEAMSKTARASAQKRKKRALPASQDQHGYPITTIKGIAISDMAKSTGVKAKLIEFIAMYVPKAMEKIMKPLGLE